MAKQTFITIHGAKTIMDNADQGFAVFGHYVEFAGARATKQQQQLAGKFLNLFPAGVGNSIYTPGITNVPAEVLADLHAELKRSLDNHERRELALTFTDNVLTNVRVRTYFA